MNIIEEELSVEELMSLYLQFNRVGTLAKLIETNKKVMSRIDIVKLIRMGQIHGFLVRNHHKIVYNHMPSPLVLNDPLKKWLADRDSRLNIVDKFE